jgi:hypothetical protein
MVRGTYGETDRSRPVLRAARAMVRRRGTYRPYERVSLDFTLELAKRLFADSSRPAVWVNLFFPSELIWGLSLVPFYPEMGAGIGPGLGLSPTGLEKSEALGYSVDLYAPSTAAQPVCAPLGSTPARMLTSPRPIFAT